MKSKQKLLIPAILIVSLLLQVVQAQPTQTLSRIYSTPSPYNIHYPILLDSINTEGEKLEKKDLLETFITFPPEKAYSNPLESELSGYIPLSKAQTGIRFHLLSFSIDVNQFAETDLKITGPGMFEAYINGVKEGSKTTLEKDYSSAKKLKLHFSAIPGRYAILIKYMSLPTNVSTEGVKITVEPTNKEEKVTYSFNPKSDKRIISIHDILTGTRISSATISPNGDYILLTLSTTEDDGTKSKITQLYNLKENTYKTLNNTYTYTWLPRSNKMYFTKKQGRKQNLMTLYPSSLTEETLAKNIPEGSFVISPNERYLIYQDKEKIENPKKDLIHLRSPEDRQPNNRDRYYLSKYDLKKGIKERLTFGKESVLLEDISPDSRYILYSVSNYTPTRRPFFVSSLYKLNIETNKIETLWEKDGFAGDAQFSPDGLHIVIKGSAEAFGGIGNTVGKDTIPNLFHNLAFVMDLSTKKVEPITKNFAPSINNITWNPQDGFIYMRATDRDNVNVFAYNPSNKKTTKIELDEEVIQSISFAHNSAKAIYFGEGVSNSTQAHVVDLVGGKSEQISTPKQKTLETILLSKVEDWSFKASDGTQIDGRFYLPPNFDPAKKYPLIVYYYGGTLPTLRTLEAPYPSHVYAALGYVVYVLQPSGTIGYGQSFAARHVNAWGKRTADDIIEGTKQFISTHRYINPQKVGCIGASYGGFMTMYLQTKTDLFAAAVSHAGISSISSYWGEGYWGYTYSAAAGAGSYPWNNKEMYVEQSPLFNADKIQTPLLLLHGTEDTNVPIGESIQLYTALKVLGKPVELVEIKGENHGVKDFKKRVEWNNTIFAWFAKWLQDDPSWWNNLYPSVEK